MKLKILVVEDRPENIAAAKECYSARDEYHFDYAKDYDEAMEALAGTPYSGIITDCFMPKRTGSGDISLGMSLVDKLIPHAKNISNPREFMMRAMRGSEAYQPLGVILVEFAQKHQIPYFMLTTRHDDFGEYIIRRWCIAKAFAWSDPREGEKSNPTFNYENSWGVALDSIAKGIEKGYQQWRKNIWSFLNREENIC